MLLLALLLAAACPPRVAAEGFCTRCFEDFSGFMLRRGAGGGAQGPITAPTGRNGERAARGPRARDAAAAAAPRH